MTLLDVMSRNADGAPAATPINWHELGRFLRDEYWDNQDAKDRKAKATTRQRFYAGQGDAEIYTMLGSVFKDPEVIRLRSEWISHAKFNNVLRRAIHELATVYSAPALRTVEGDDNNARYQEMQRRTRMHEVMQRVNRLAYLHRAVFVYPRIRLDAAGNPEPVIEVVTPDRFDAITHPADPTLLVAISIDLRLKSAAQLVNLPARMIVSATETVMVDAHGGILTDTVRPHDVGRIPGVLFTIDPPAGALFDPSATDDLESAHRAVWFENILLLKESKSATKQTVVSGDVSSVERNQVDDSERPGHLPEGTSATTLDRAMDLRLFRDTARDIYETAAANHGIPPVTLNHGGVQSADARELVRTPLKEIRLAQQVPFRDFERDLAAIQSLVYAPIPEVAFTTEGWSVDFADPQTPLGQNESLDVFLKERQAGLTSTVAEIMRRNPDLTYEAAWVLAERYIEDEARRLAALRPTMAASGALGGVAARADGAPVGGRPPVLEPGDAIHAEAMQ